MAERQTISMGHPRRYQEEQPELAIWCLLYNPCLLTDGLAKLSGKSYESLT